MSGAYTPEKAASYTAALKKEISSIPADRPLSTLYIGGGTPTVLTADQLSDLTDHIFKHFSFIDDHESTIEANPGTLDSEKLTLLHSSGMNRISIGVQSFSNDELAFLGRIHTESEAEEAIKLAKDAGFRNLGIDLIYGIPGQEIENWEKTLEKAASLRPDHISTYELTVEEGTELHKLLDKTSSSHPPLYKGGRRGGISRLNEDQIIEMYEQTIKYLSSKGYLHYEISNFALPGSFSRHNLNYWDRGDYYGAGAGAHSFVNNKRSYNTADLDQYLKLASGMRSPVEHSEEITPEAAISEAMFLGLRKTGGINVEAFAKRYGRNILTLYEKEIKKMQEAGLIETCLLAGRQADSEYSNETNIRLTPKGFLLSNEVFVKFI